MKTLLYRFIFAITISAIIFSCARPGFPTGGLKDETPPKVTSSSPSNYTVNFGKKRISINFDEFVVLKDLNKKFMVSPPMKTKPTVRLKGRSIVVYIEDTLKKDATYTLDFADAIVDNNEGNPLGNFQYTFSTGNKLDSLSISGYIENSFDQLPIEGALVMIYSDKADSVVYNKIPDYISKTDSLGHFVIRNIKDANYKIFALNDANKDFKFNGTGEEIGFLDTQLHATAEYVTEQDTIVKYTQDSVAYDSIYAHRHIKYSPSDIYIRMFKEKSEQLYLTKAKRLSRHLLHFGFNRERTDSLKINLIGINQGDNWYRLDKNHKNDSLNYWISDSTIYNRDSLMATIQYLKTDSLMNMVSVTDTIKLNFRPKKKGKLTKKQEEKLSKRKKESLKIDIQTGSTLDIYKDVTLVFNQPIDTIRNSMIHLYSLQDTTEVSEKISIIKDSSSILKYHIQHKWKYEQNYKIVIDSLAINNIYNLYNNKQEANFKVREKEYYGELFINYTNVTSPIIVQLTTADKSKKLVQEKTISKDEKVSFLFLKAGHYNIKTIIDQNNNGKWDTGKYLNHTQPEKVYLFPKEIEIRSNWSSEESIIIPKK